MTILDDLSELPKSANIILYGPSYAVWKIKESTEVLRNDINFIGYLDENIEIAEYLNTFFRNFGLKNDVIIIVSSNWLTLYKKLKGTRYNTVIASFGLFCGNRIITEFQYRTYKKYFQKARELFVDNQDRILYDLIIKSRHYNPMRILPLHDFLERNKNCYRKEYLDFINTHVVETVIEGGVYDGGNTLDFLNAFTSGVSIYGFDPFIEVYKEGKFRKILDNDTNIKISRSGLWSKSGRAKFLKSSFDKEASRIVHDDSTPGQGNIVDVETISIDDFILSRGIRKIDFIKLDIEGAEFNTLKGGIVTLKRDRPQMAICIYHAIEDLFRIPLLISKNLHHYVFKLGHYSKSLSDTVLYAIPSEVYKDRKN